MLNAARRNARMARVSIRARMTSANLAAPCRPRVDHAQQRSAPRMLSAAPRRGMVCVSTKSLRSAGKTAARVHPMARCARRTVSVARKSATQEEPAERNAEAAVLPA